MVSILYFYNKNIPLAGNRHCLIQPSHMAQELHECFPHTSVPMLGVSQKKGQPKLPRENHCASTQRRRFHRRSS
jgi:hypothetical protein